MIRRSLATVYFVGCMIATLPAWAAEPVVIEGRVVAVTVYQGQALVTRELDVPEAQGPALCTSTHRHASMWFLGNADLVVT
jgi:hypothetical protein